VGRPVVGLGAASNGPDWRSIRDVLSVARFASALVSKHQSPLVNACVGSALLQAPSFSYGVVDLRQRTSTRVHFVAMFLVSASLSRAFRESAVQRQRAAHVPGTSAIACKSWAISVSKKRPMVPIRKVSTLVNCPDR